MAKYKNLAITGAKGAGKSTLAKDLLAELELPFAGFRSERYDLTAEGPLYQLVQIGGEAAVPISHLTPEGIRGIPASFDTVGVEMLLQAEAAPGPVILLDEIGRFERNSEAFLAELFTILDGPKRVIAVLKQEELPHIRAIRQREDTLLLDLDRISREQAREMGMGWYQERAKPLQP